MRRIALLALGFGLLVPLLASAPAHAQASRASVSIHRRDGLLAIDVQDDGVGGANSDGPGLRALADRVGALDGTMTVHSPAGGGTQLSAQIPCAT